MRRRSLVAGLAMIPFVARAGQRDKRQKHEARKERELRELSERLLTLKRQGPVVPQQSVLHRHAEALILEARSADAGTYLLGRLLKACDSLLDASHELDRLRTRQTDKDDTRDRTARDLTRSYFRVKEGEFYASQAKHFWASELVPMAQHFYQLARREYDAVRYTRARRYAEAARELISALEAIAQAAVRNPEPPDI